jgi:hypothetical protein
LGLIPELPTVTSVAPGTGDHDTHATLTGQLPSIYDKAPGPAQQPAASAKHQRA